MGCAGRGLARLHRHMQGQKLFFKRSRAAGATTASRPSGVIVTLSATKTGVLRVTCALACREMDGLADTSVRTVRVPRPQRLYQGADRPWVVSRARWRLLIVDDLRGVLGKRGSVGPGRSLLMIRERSRGVTWSRRSLHMQERCKSSHDPNFVVRFAPKVSATSGEWASERRVLATWLP